jgi:hypothetical protein
VPLQSLSHCPPRRTTRCHRPHRSSDANPFPLGSSDGTDTTDDDDDDDLDFMGSANAGGTPHVTFASTHVHDLVLPTPGNDGGGVARGAGGAPRIVPLGTRVTSNPGQGGARQRRPAPLDMSGGERDLGSISETVV